MLDVMAIIDEKTIRYNAHRLVEEAKNFDGIFKHVLGDEAEAARSEFSKTNEQKKLNGKPGVLSDESLNQAVDSTVTDKAKTLESNIVDVGTGRSKGDQTSIQDYMQAGQDLGSAKSALESGNPLSLFEPVTKLLNGKIGPILKAVIRTIKSMFTGEKGSFGDFLADEQAAVAVNDFATKLKVDPETLMKELNKPIPANAAGADAKSNASQLDNAKKQAASSMGVKPPAFGNAQNAQLPVTSPAFQNAKPGVPNARLSQTGAR